MRWLGAVVLAAGAVGCGRGPYWPVILTSCEENPDTCASTVTLQRSADILFVIDNSGSMGDEQGTLAANFPAFVSVLEGELVGASYRIGVTTTSRTGLAASSCRSRLGDFIFDDIEGVFIDERERGCIASCGFDEIALLPSENPAGSDSVVVRPWLEKVNGRTNLPSGVSMTEALQCIGPQGINGVGFEAPLESMREIVENDIDLFMRDDALLAIIFVTDEADCSAPFDHIDALTDPFLSQALWGPGAEDVTSAVCWNAGVDCEGGPGVYETCHSQDKGLEGEPTNPEDAVLYPVELYIDVLREASNRKQRRGGNGQTLVALIAGVPEDYPQGGELIYQDSNDPEFNEEYGIGPGCNFGEETRWSPPGIPPVRLREFSEAFATDRRNIFSICSEDYAIALEEIAEAIERLGARACVPGCVADTNENVDGIQPLCSIFEVDVNTGDAGASVPQCLNVGAAWEFPGEVDLCYRPLSDADGATPSTLDDMSQQCETRGSNMEFILERREGVPVLPGAAVQVDCELIEPVGDGCPT